MTLVADSSVVAAALVDSGRDGIWAAQLLAADELAVPYLMPAEVANIRRGNVTAYDAWYVALAEALGARLATLGVKLQRAAGPRCAYVTPG